MGVDHHRSRWRWRSSGNLVSDVESDVADLIAENARADSLARMVMYERMFSKRERSMKNAERRAQDMRAWVMIAAIFLATMLVVWVPLILNALPHG